MKNIIYVSLLIIAFSKINIIEYGKDIPFDINNNEFELTFNEAGALLVSVTFGTPDILKLNMIFKGNEYNYPVSPPGLGTIMLFKPNDINKIKLEYLSPSNENGTIWLQPTTEEIQIKLNQTYQWKYNLKAYFTHNKIYQLVYSINKSEKDAILEFKYDNNFNVENNIIAPNPLKICHGEICNNSITTYNIKKGESYKIYITLKIFQKTNKYAPVLIIYLPSFSFNFIYVEEKKHKEEKTTELKNENSNIFSDKLNIILIISIILLIILGIIYILLCRKKGKSNIENHANEDIESELKEAKEFNFEREI